MVESDEKRNMWMQQQQSPSTRDLHQWLCKGRLTGIESGVDGHEGFHLYTDSFKRFFCFFQNDQNFLFPLILAHPAFLLLSLSLSLSLHISLYILTNFLTLCYMMPFVGARPYRYILRSLHMFISLCTLLMFAYLYDCVTLFLLELRLTVSYTCSLPLFCTSLSFFLSFFLYLPIFLHLLLHFFPSSHFSLSLFSTSCLPICPSKFVPYKSWADLVRAIFSRNFCVFSTNREKLFNLQTRSP